MSASQPARCLLRASKSALPKRSPNAQRRPSSRPFHQTCIRNVRRRRPTYASLNREELAELEAEAKTIRKYTPEELRALQNYYTPAQLEAVKEGEKAVDPRDLVTQGSLRDDPWRIRYVEDFRVIDPIVDNQPQILPTQAPTYAVTEAQGDEFADRVVDMLEGGMDTRSIEDMIEEVKRSPLATQKTKDFAERFRAVSMSEQEVNGKQVLRRLLYRLNKGLELVDGRKSSTSRSGSSAARRDQSKPSMQNAEGNQEAADNLKAMGLDPHDELAMLQTGNKEAFRNSLNDPRLSSMTPKIPRFSDPRIARDGTGEDQDATEAGLARLSLITGQSTDVLKRINTKELVYRRVVNQTRMGKIASQSILCVAGNGNGLIGIGEGKSTEATDARVQAQMAAIRNMKPVLRYEDRTIYGDVEAKVGATEVELSTRPPGFGVRCQHLIFEVCKLAGIHDLSARVVRSRNPMNTVKATVEALTKQRLPEDIARARGKKLVDVRKVYYAGLV